MVIFIDGGKMDRFDVKITDNADFAREYAINEIPYIVVLNEKNKNESFPNGAYCVENIDDIDDNYKEMVYCRTKGLPLNILETQRLIVREITVSDVQCLYELYADESVTRYMEPLFEEMQQEIDYTKDYIKNIYGFYGYGMWILVLKESNEIIGRAGLEYKEGFDGLELGFMLGTKYQHKGYAYEACKAIVEYAKEYLEQSSFRAVVHIENQASRRLCERLGFKIDKCDMGDENKEYIKYSLSEAVK